MNRQSRIWLSVLTVALAVGLLSSRAWAQGKSDPSGTWKWSFTTQDGQTRESTLKLKLDGGKLTGTVTGREGQETAIEEASFKDGELAFQVSRERDGQKFVIKYKGKVTGDELAGAISFEVGGETRTREFAAKRAGSSTPTAAGPAADLLGSLKKGSPDLKSAGSLAFGPQGILFVGDTTSAAIFAFDTGDRTAGASAGEFKIESINEKIAAMVGTTAQNLMINDLAVNPISGKAYLSVARGKGPDATPVIVRADRAGKIEAVSLADIGFAKAPLPNPPSAEVAPQQKGQSPRGESITDLAYVDGRVIVAGLSNEEFSSRLLAIPFPFSESGKGASIEIYHGAHGRFETKSPVRTFVPFKIGGEQNLLAAYTCTPLVKFPVSDLKPGTHVKGTTVAELGNRNRPLDMIVYQKGGKDFLLLANSSRGVMKISTEGIGKAESITEPVKDGGTRGQTYDTIAELKGIMQLDSLDKDNALVLVQTEGGSQNLLSIALP